MYILVRKDLSETYRCVQGSHALAQFALEFPEEFKKWNNSTIVFLGVRNLIELKTIKGKLMFCSVFREPDLENQETAIAFYGQNDELKNLKTV
jgi:hypothetical protein